MIYKTLLTILFVVCILHRMTYSQNDETQNDNGQINLLTGAPICKMNLFSITSKSGIKYDVDIAYSGSIQREMSNNNLVAPTGIVGLGWHFSQEAIIRDAKGTPTETDDKFYYLQQSGVLNNMIDLGNNTYQIEKYPYWKVLFVSGFFVIIYPDGTRLEYGSRENSVHYMQYNNDFNDYGDQNVVNFQYDLSLIKSPNGNGSITFNYTNHTDAKFKQTINNLDYDKRRICTYTHGDVQDGHVNGFHWNGGLDVDIDGCLADYDVRCLELHSNNYWNKTDLENSAPELKNQDLSRYRIQKDFTGFNYIFPCCGYDAWDVVLVLKNPIDNVTNIKKGIYVDESTINSITGDNGIRIDFSYQQKNGDEWDGPIFGNNNIVLKSVHLLENNEIKEKILFTYSGDDGQVPRLNAGAGEKRLLTGIKSGSVVGINKVFEYGNENENVGLLKKNIDILTGKTIAYNYKLQQTHTPSGDMRSVEVVDKITVSDGIGANPDIVTNYTYPTVAQEQYLDTASGIPFWGEVTTFTTAGHYITNFDINKANNKFGTIERIRQYNASSKLIGDVVYQYSIKTYGTQSSPIYTPVLIKTTSMKNGVEFSNGTSECAIDANSGIANQSWEQNSDGATLVTKRKYAYEIHSEMGLAGTNQLNRVASTELIKMTSYDPLSTTNACDLTAGNVIKSTYTVWSMNNLAQWHPAAMYEWNSPMNSQGVPTAAYNIFNENNPIANGWQLKGTIDKYDTYGNALQITNAKGVSTATIFGTTNYLPIANVVNSKIGECYFSSFEEEQIWTFSDQTTKAIGREKTIQKNGQWSAVITNSSSNAELYAESPWGSIDKGETESREFTFSGWVYSTGPQAEIFFFASVNSASYETGHYTNVVAPMNTQNKWVFLKGTFKAPVGAKYFMIRIDNNGAVDANKNVYFDDLKFYPSDALMATTYYDTKWRTPVLTIDANENTSDLLKLDESGRPNMLYKTDKQLSSNDQSGYILKKQIEYHLDEQLRLLSPVGGEVLVPGTKCSIKWIKTIPVGSSGVDILFYNGSTWSTIATVTDENQNAYLWTVPSIEATGCLIKVVNNSNASDYSQCVTPFSITNYLTITTPAEGDVYWSSKRVAPPWNSPHNVQWVTSGGTDVNVRIDFYDGIAWRPITSSTPNDGSFDWVLNGSVRSDWCRIRIGGVNGTRFSRESKPFSVKSNHGFLRRLNN